MSLSPSITGEPSIDAAAAATASSQSDVEEITTAPLSGAGPSRAAAETEPLLDGNAARSKKRKRKPFYRARPLWLVPFAVTAALVRGMTLAPRVTVYTQLACVQAHPHHPYNHTQQHLDSLSNLNFTSLPYPIDDPTYAPLGVQDDDEDPRRIPSAECPSDPAVQRTAARLQVTMTTTMGLLSALTTGWWGHWGERNGRTRVLAFATMGWLLSDLTFILVSTPGTPFSERHGHKWLLLSPVLEGIFGGWSTLQSATTAYVSDCTSSGSRAHIFSRFTGMFYIGFSLGPSIGGYIIRSGLITAPWTTPDDEKSVVAVFWVATLCSLFNFLMVVFVFPESLSKEKRGKAAEAHRLEHQGFLKGKSRATVTTEVVEEENPPSKKRLGFVYDLLSPLAIFLPVPIPDENGRTKRDWSLTFLSAVLFSYFLSAGILQVKYLYAGHVYSWGAEKLSYYISFLGGMRALHLLVLLPLIISGFKPKPTQSSLGPGKTKPKLTKSLLAREIHFDLFVSRFSLILDVLSNVFVTIFPAPTYKMHSLTGQHPSSTNSNESQALFVLASSLSSIGSGLVPALQSLALSIVQARALAHGAEVPEGAGAMTGNVGIGRLFGALAVMQSIGQMILGPIIFGLVYGATVADYPKAIFVLAACLLSLALVAILFVRSPVGQARQPGKGPAGKGKAKKRWSTREEEEAGRGRSRVSKDLKGGALPADSP